MDRNRKALIYAGVAVTLWASTAAAVKLLLEGVDSYQLLFLVSLLSAVTLGIIRLASGRRQRHAPRERAFFAAMGFVGIFLYSLLLYRALELSTAQEAFIVNYTWPLWTVIFASLLLRERIGWRKAGALLTGFAGVVIVATQGRFELPTHLAGDLLALGAAVCYGLFSALGKKYPREQSALMLDAFVTSTLCSAALLPFVSSFPTLTLRTALGVAWLGVFATAIPFLAWFLALEHGDTGMLSNVVFLTPFLSLVYIRLLLGEEIRMSSIAGLICIVAGILLQVERTASAQSSPAGNS